MITYLMPSEKRKIEEMPVTGLLRKSNVEIWVIKPTQLEFMYVKMHFYMCYIFMDLSLSFIHVFPLSCTDSERGASNISGK